jgi:4-amino-4-deoxy-L-arabinose transferase-like glycosyltransferase
MNFESIVTKQFSLDRRSWIIISLLIIILLIGADLRLLSVIHTRIVEPAIRADARDYVLYAYNLRNFGIYSRSDTGLMARGEGRNSLDPAPDAVRSPGYPLFLSLLIGHDITGKTVQNILLAQAVLGILTILLVFDLSRKFLSVPLGLFAALLTAISPHLVTATVYLLSETLFCFLMVLSFWLFAWAVNRRSFVGFLFAGMVLGAAALTRPAVQYFIVPFSLLLVFWRPVRFRLVAVLVLGCALAFLPWTFRNLYTFGKVSDNTLKINTLHHGMYPDFMYNGDPKTFGYPYRYDPESSKIAQSVGTVMNTIQKRFQAAPATYLKWYLIGKPVMLWSWNLTESIGGPFIYAVNHTPYSLRPLFRRSYVLMGWLHWLLVVLGLLGCISAWLPQHRIGLTETALMITRAISLLLLFYVAVHMVGAPFPRYSVPMRPFLYAIALFPLEVAYRRIIRRSLNTTVAHQL